MRLPPRTQLSIRWKAELAGDTIFLTGAVQRPDGTINRIGVTLTAAAALTDQQDYVDVGDGDLIGVVATLGTTANAARLRYARIGLSIGQVSDVTQYMVLTQGYVSGGHAIYWPGGPMDSAYDSPLEARTWLFATPAAGADWASNFTNIGWHPGWAFHADFNASAAVASRNIAVYLLAGNLLNEKTWYTGNVTAGQTQSLHVLPWSVTPTTGSGNIYMQAPAMNLPPGTIISSNTANIDAGDQFSNLQFIGRPYLLMALQH